MLNAGAPAGLTCPERLTPRLLLAELLAELSTALEAVFNAAKDGFVSIGEATEVLCYPSQKYSLLTGPKIVEQTLII